MEGQTADTQVTATGADQNSGQGTQTQNAVNNTQQVATPPATPYKAYTNKDDFDNHAAMLKGKGKEEAEKELLAMLGLKPEQKDEIEKIKKAYDSSLSDAEKANKQLEAYKGAEATYKAQLIEKDHVIAALIKISGKQVSDVEMQIKMAKGLVSDAMTFEQAFDMVMNMTNQTQTVAPATHQNNIPTGQPLNQPAAKNSAVDNPFIKDASGNYNMDNISRLAITNPKLAAGLAQAAGFPVTWRY